MSRGRRGPAPLRRRPRGRPRAPGVARGTPRCARSRGAQASLRASERTARPAQRLDDELGALRSGDARPRRPASGASRRRAPDAIAAAQRLARRATARRQGARRARHRTDAGPRHARRRVRDPHRSPRPRTTSANTARTTSSSWSAPIPASRRGRWPRWPRAANCRASASRCRWRRSTPPTCPCLVFDEVDAGVGGAVAEMVGRQLRRSAGSGRCCA